jgi:hypothetical protein
MRIKFIRQILTDASMALEEKISGMSLEEATALVRHFRIEVKSGFNRQVAREQEDLPPSKSSCRICPKSEWWFRGRRLRR